MSIELEKKLAIISGKTPDDFDIQMLSDADKEQIGAALEMLFAGQTLAYWMAGNTLGQSWRGAYNYVRDFIYKMPSDNAVVVYLKHVTVSYLSKWDYMIISSHNFNDLVKCPADETDEWNARAGWQINEGQAIILAKIAQFKPTGTQISQPKVTPVLRKEREHERDERVRSRT